MMPVLEPNTEGWDSIQLTRGKGIFELSNAEKAKKRRMKRRITLHMRAHERGFISKQRDSFALRMRSLN
jgi:hypothetical protein